MPLKLNVGFSKKLGLPGYGSVGASCAVELELAPNLLDDDLEAFHRQVRSAHAVCRQAVLDELALQRSPPAAEAGNAPSPDAGPENPEAPGPNGNGRHESQEDGSGASARQMAYLRQLAAQIPGLGMRSLDAAAERLFGRPATALESRQASELIDVLRAVRAGTRDLAGLLGQIAS